MGFSYCFNGDVSARDLHFYVFPCVLADAKIHFVARRRPPRDAIVLNDLLENRRIRLRALAGQWGGPAALAKKLQLSDSYLSQLLGGQRPISEKTARKIEDALDLPALWLDRDAAASQPVRALDESLVSRAVMAVGSALDTAGLQVSPRKFADLVALVYESAVESNAIDDTYVTRIVKLIARE